VVAGDLAVAVALALVVIRAGVGIAHARVGQQLVVGLQLGVPGGDACFGLAVSSGQPPVAGAFAGLGAAVHACGEAAERHIRGLVVTGTGIAEAGPEDLDARIRWPFWGLTAVTFTRAGDTAFFAT
jgi:hypothetical protein